MAKSKTTKTNDTSANLGFEANLWLAADQLRNNMDAAEYKHVALGLIFLKYISETFDEHQAKLVASEGEHLLANVFGVPKEARWPQLQRALLLTRRDRIFNG